MIALHLGSLHPVEQALTVALALGPLVVLGLVVLLRGRRDGAAGEGASGSAPDGGQVKTGTTTPARSRRS